MNCVLFAKNGSSFQLKKNRAIKNTGKMAKNTGKVREKSGNFVSPEKWEPCISYGSCGELNEVILTTGRGCGGKAVHTYSKGQTRW